MCKYAVPIAFNLIGEEGLSFGKPVLSIALGYYVFVTVQKSSALRIPDAYKKVIQLCNETVKKYLHKKAISFHNYCYTVKISTDLEYTTSQTHSALLVGLTQALYEFYTHLKLSPEETNKIAFTVEKKINKRSNGLALSVSTFGGVIFYRKEFEFLKAVHRLPFKLPETFLKILSLKEELITPVSVENFFSLNSKKAEEYLTSLEKYTKRIALSFIKEDLSFFRATFSDYIKARNEFFSLDSPYLSINENVVLEYKNNKKTIPFKESYQGVRSL